MCSYFSKRKWSKRLIILAITCDGAQHTHSNTHTKPPFEYKSVLEKEMMIFIVNPSFQQDGGSTARKERLHKPKMTNHENDNLFEKRKY